MGATNRRSFLQKAATGSASVAASLTLAGLFPRRIFADNSSSFHRIVYRDLGSTGFKVSEIGFGAMNMRDPELVQAAIDSGINYIDTANAYMNGVNEEIIGKVLKNQRDRVFLTTKVLVKDPKDTSGMIGMMETSLKRLQTDHVDLMLLHDLKSRSTVLNEDFIKVFDQARKKGICRFVGTSTHQNNAEVLDAAVESKFWEAVLVGYSYVSPPEVKASIEKARKAGIAIIAMKSLLNPVNLASWQWNPIKDIRKDRNDKITSTQALLKWVLDDPYIDTIIPGMTTFEQLAEDVGVMGMKMSFEDHRILNRYGENIKTHYCCGVAGCTGCQNQCPRGVRVNDLNRCLGYAYGYGNFDLAMENYARLPKSSRIDACFNCTECVVKCVNGLNITQNIKRAKELFA